MPAVAERHSNHHPIIDMSTINERLARYDWSAIETSLHTGGYAVVPSVVTKDECDGLIASYDVDALYRKTVIMERHRFGIGEYRYFRYPLPDIIADLRTAIYPHIVPVANAWMDMLGIDTVYPADHTEFLRSCHDHGQTLPTALILKYGPDGYNTLHQDLYGALYFPMQLVLFLNQPGTDYRGGEFVLTEQVPRAQSRATVLNPGQGDLLLFTTNFRPIRGSRGHYRSAVKHGVSTVLDGERHTLGIIFHDATS